MIWIIFVMMSPMAYCAYFEFTTDDHGRIVGGRNADIELYNYQISLKFLGNHTCGGSLLKSNIVVTAAHCVYRYSNYVEYFVVYAGSSLLSKLTEYRAVKSIHINPQYNDTALDYDSAILILASPFALGKNIGTVGLIGRGRKIFPGTVGIVTGWGYTQEGQDISNRLQYVVIPKVYWNVCKEKYKTYELTKRMSCWGYVSGGKDACQGDSGGPLVVYHINNIPELAGIVSWGVGCARRDYPGVYTDVSNVQIRDFLSQFL